MANSTALLRRALLIVVVVVPFGAAIAAQSPQVPPRDSGQSSRSVTGTGRITGLVVAADNGAPVKRARVQLVGLATIRTTGQGPSGAQMTFQVAVNGVPASGLRLEAECDSTGHFEFTGVPPGHYSLNAAVQSGFVNSSRSETLDVRDGATETVMFRLERTAVISGRILDEYGDPVVRAQVFAARRNPFGGPAMMNSSATTDDLGQYRLFDLRPGVYQVGAMLNNSAGSPQNGRPRPGLVPTYYPGVASADLAGTIPVKAAQEAGASFSLVRAVLGCVRGTVVDSTGTWQRSGGGLNVSIRPRSAQDVSISRGVQVQPDGTFSICDMPPGDYYLIANSYRTGPAPSAAPPASEGAYTLVTVNGGEARADIQTNLGATLSGRIVVEGGTASTSLAASTAEGGSTGGMGNASGAPRNPSRGSVMARPGGANNSNAYASPGSPATVQDDGTFDLTGVRGQVLLTASLNGQQATLKAVLRGTEDITTTPMELSGVERINDVTIVFTRDTGTLEGMVTNDRGDPVPDAIVLLFPDDPKRCTSGSPFVRQARSLSPAAAGIATVPTTTAPGQTGPASARMPGQVQLASLVPGHYVVVAFDPRGEPMPTPDAQTLERLRSLATSVEIKAGETAKVDLRLTKLDGVIGG